MRPFLLILGKSAAAFIDSPNQGPVLYSEKFDNNQIVLLKKDGGGKPAWVFGTGKDVVYHVSLSDDGEFLAAGTERSLYLFSKNNNTPLWRFCKRCDPLTLSMGENSASAISGDGKYAAISFNGMLYFFSRESNKPLWEKSVECNAVGIDLSKYGDFVAVGTSNCGEQGGNKAFLFDKNGNKIWEYKLSNPGYENPGEFYGPAMTPDGGLVAISSGCPNRRAYLFKGDGTLLFRSDPLQRDAPVHKSAISDDGNYLTFGSDGESGKPNKFLFSKSGALLWSHAGASETDARAISISADGNYVAAGTSGGKVYLFKRDSSMPLWVFQETGNFAKVGDVKLNNDGSLLAAGSTGKKVYLFSRDSASPLWSFDALTWVNSVDFKGEFIAAGTGFKEYQFEGNSASQEQVSCESVIQPPAMEQFFDGGQNDAQGERVEGKCGNNICEPVAGETAESCPDDCISNEVPIGGGLGASCKGEGCFIQNDGNRTLKSYCGNGVCEEQGGENAGACPADCPASSRAGLEKESGVQAGGFPLELAAALAAILLAAGIAYAAFFHKK